ncbi:MAG: heparan-alpha-glucosaminide N-acetyltransferase domain-containing protein [Firmicutes bacterium]|nr:heparan-alpha-glucosaminide N-acetyltransferase domain-containing protein [Bacillota bacterium]
MEEKLPQEKKRDFALDNFRGLIIVFLLLFFYYETIPYTPAFLLHAADGEIMRFADYIASGFMLALVFAFAIGLEKYAAANDYKGAVKRYASRYLALIGVGFLLVAIPAIMESGTLFRFNVFSVFGVAGLLSLFFIKLNRWWQLGIGCGLIVLYQLLLFVPAIVNYVTLPQNDFGGLFGAIAWCGFIMAAMFLAKTYRNSFKQFSWAVLGFVLAAVVFGAASLAVKLTGGGLEFFMASKTRVSMPFVFVTLGAGAAVFWLFAKFSVTRQIPVLTWYGRNSLVMFIFATGAGRGLAVLTNLFITSASAAYVLPLGMLAILVLSALFAYVLYRFKITITV